MKYPSNLIIAIAIFFQLNLLAQNTTEKKIVGCWQLDKMEFVEPNENSEQIVNEAKNTVICFNQNGKFINKKSDNIIVSEGTYQISPDEKTINQSSEMPNQNNDIQNQRINVPGQIIVLNEKEFHIKTEFVIIFFKKIIDNAIKDNAIKDNAVSLANKGYQIEEVKIVKRSHKNPGKSKRFKGKRNSLLTMYNAKISQIAQFFKNESGALKYIKNVKFKSYSSQKDRLVNLLFYAVAEDGSPQDLLYNKNIACKIKKGYHTNSIDVDQFNISLPKNGIFIAIDIPIIEQNKYFIDKINNPRGFFYEPLIYEYQKPEYSRWYLSEKNKWEKINGRALDIQIITSE